MAHFAEAVALLEEARQENAQAESREKGVADDTASALSVVGNMPETLATLADVLDTQLENTTAASELAKAAHDHVLSADEEGHFEESQNALVLLDHVHETALGQMAVLVEAKEALVILLARLDEVKLSFEQVHAAADETVTSTGGAEANLEQLVQRLAG